MTTGSEVSEWEAVVAAWRLELGRNKQDGLHWEPIPGPATPAAIGRAEQRLGIAMPTVLVDLYRLADGLPELGGDHYGVRGCAELEWFRVAEAELIEIWDDLNDESGVLTAFVELMRAGLAVSKGGDEQKLLLVATGSGVDDWQLHKQWNSGSGVTPCPSLATEYLELTHLRRANRSR